ncbi:glycosyltransferase family 2 protein [Azospirillum sp.]|uniref:glycosyltransferase family 2 protein n=1 Tax=Azospirillum sp. TaxID=34012 RepID=UPI002D6A4AD9|nr:glycosyltransferase family 2 protein [Azospirillum sp.]HYD65227.1 glycosyltransferase family 2 protein [Azospirillum sp.]
MSQPSPFPDNAVAAVVVTHHPDATVARTLAAALEQAHWLVVVDNASAVERLAPVEDAVRAAGTRAELLRNAGNLGIAAAQNQGITRARALGARHVLLLDQDSVAQPGMVAALLDALDSGERVGMAVPVTADDGQRKPTRFLVSADGRRAAAQAPERPVLHHLLYAIASGSLIPMAVLDEVGPMREDFFIDFVDVEFGLRLRRAGWDIVAAREARLRHRLGAYEERRLLGRAVPVTHHSAKRRYTQYRNRVRTLRLYGGTLPAFLRAELPAIAVDLLRLVLFERGRPAKIAATVRGALAGLFGR